MPLFQRIIRVTVGGLQVEQLRCEFSVKKNLRAQPNTCTARITNLSEEHRKGLSQPRNGKLFLTLEAGYKTTGLSRLFRGEVRRASTVWQGPDAITTVTTGDSEKEMQESHIQATFAVGTKAEAVLLELAKALGVGPGNVQEAAALLQDRGAFSQGTAFSGSASRCMTDFCRSFGLTWSVQDGVLQILERGQPIATSASSAIVLNAGTGLEGSPSVDFKPSSKDSAGGVIVKCKTRLIPGLAPGRVVSLDSVQSKGLYKIDEVTWDGDTHGTTWGTQLTLSSY